MSAAGAVEAPAAGAEPVAGSARFLAEYARPRLAAVKPWLRAPNH
jgi:hypothetical protein